MKFAKLKMIEKLSTHGLIYFSNVEEPKSGLLEYNDNQINLTFVVEGFLDTLDELELDITNIVFITSFGEKLLLRDGIVLNSKNNSNNIITIEVIYQYLLLDTNPQIESVSEENHYKNFKIYCSYFKDIFTNSPFRYGRKKEDRFHSSVELNLESTLGLCIINNRMEVTDFILANQYNRGEDFDLKFDYTPFLNFKFKEPQSFNNIISQAMKIRNLISFITEHQIKVEELYISTKEKNYKIFWANESNIQVSKPSNELTFQVKPFLNRRFSEFVDGYFNNEDKLTDIFDTYVNYIYKPIYEDDYLLSHIVILEGLHRRFICDKDITLKIRLEEMFKSLDREIINSIFSEIELDEKFISYLKDFRHYHSHFFDINKKPRIDGNKIEIAKLIRKVIKEFIYLKINVGESYVLAKPRQYQFKELDNLK
ncbi:hypothetical protein E4T89_04195 [Jeotgalicoccus nanhaiensis]|uniref:ApeA N-terminal domain-containing protein n=1 Tax=Jeotgalicoccus nanhaiensis TaxID=568603 RepID=A0ABR9XWU3_9STAP|nr:hypothetical protein [Jeotgalicoccus nanhaiensis]MBF0753464.1 hypothetical protein [Jeotgalicoccus nanhaiensis]TFU62622.1 hypothetical protein E4T89_04195 [Jeotgalicoccus nanhaiensis]